MPNLSLLGGSVINPSFVPAPSAPSVSSFPVGLVGDLLGLGYNIFANERQFQYQRELNSSIMSREDTAIQRAMADAQNAGLSRMQALGQTASTANYSSADPSMIQTNFAEAQSRMDSLGFSYKELEELKRHNRETELNTAKASADYSQQMLDQLEELKRHNKSLEGTGQFSADTARLIADLQKQVEDERQKRINLLTDNGIVVDADGNPIMTSESTTASGKIGPVSGSGSHSETKPLLLNSRPDNQNTEIFPEDGGRPREFEYDGIRWSFHKHWVLGLAGNDAFPVYEGRDTKGQLVHAWFDPVSGKFIRQYEFNDPSALRYIGPDVHLNGIHFYSSNNVRIDDNDLTSYEGGKYEQKKKKKK